VATLDILTYSMKVIGKISQKVNLFFMLKTPYIHNMFYNITSTKLGGDFIDSISTTIFKNNRMKKQIANFDPDLVVCTHFFGPSLIKYYQELGLIRPKLVTVVTDYDVIELWIKNHKIMDYIVVGNKDMQNDLIRRGVDKNKIKVFGIPIAPKMNYRFNRKKMLKEYNLSGNNKICLFFGGGGAGSSKTLPYIKRLAKNNPDLDIIYIAGKNEHSKYDVDEYVREYNLHNVRTLGFVSNVPELLELCDFVISKPGGIQLTECLYFKKPVFMIRHSGGQEIANYKYFESVHFGKYFRTSFGLNRYIKKMLSDDDLLYKYSREIKLNTSNDAMKKLYKLIKDII
jgi:processive 1,2-diacylglycerol beta-glucosyltransferase